MQDTKFHQITELSEKKLSLNKILSSVISVSAGESLKTMTRKQDQCKKDALSRAN